MKKYNRDKRAKYNAHIKKMHMHDTCDTHDKCTRIHINVHYDGYNHTEYVKIIYGKTRDTHAQTYVNTTNAIRDIFPELDKEHKSHVYRANAPYRKYPKTDDTPYTRALKWQERVMEDSMKEETIHKDTRTVNTSRHTIEITLHRNKRTMHAYERAVDPDRIIHNMTVRDIKAHDVEIYYI